MPVVYRLLKKKRLADAFSGEGARLYGGRWNSRGKACTYVAGTEALAILEVMVHLSNYEQLKDFVLLELEIPDDLIEIPGNAQLPDNWREDPAPVETLEIGDRFLECKELLALQLPSTIAPREHIFLLNPGNSDYEKVTGKAKELEFYPDPRLVKD
ncbi:MAG: RES domain-containing protein [Halomonadaceae bacterium]|nr:MAG: RES domain-containing protein [Halomonadaceae bacterium]